MMKLPERKQMFQRVREGEAAELLTTLAYLGQPAKSHCCLSGKPEEIYCTGDGLRFWVIE